MNDIYIDGPLYDNHDVCPASDYVCSFRYIYTVVEKTGINGSLSYGEDGVIEYDLYVVNDGDGRQVVLWREDSEYSHSYGAATFQCLIQARNISQLNDLIITVLFEKGKFLWSKNSK